MNSFCCTKWVVISGAPSSGKTSVIEHLAGLGFDVEPEAARAVIEEEMAAGRNLADVRSDASFLQLRILERKLRREAVLEPQARIFLDRAMPDSVTYFRLAGLDIAPALEACQRFRYDRVFLFDRLPLEKDGVRVEDEAQAARIDGMLEEDYALVGYHPVRVPVMSIKARADFILAHLDEQEQDAKTVKA